MGQTLFNKVKYVAPIKCIIDRPIAVYDITKANISVLREFRVIDERYYNFIGQMSKRDREIIIGNLIGSNPNIAKILSNGIIESKKRFFEINSITDGDVLEIDNDSITLVGDAVSPSITGKVGEYISFRLDKKYTSYYKIKNIQYFYYANPIEKVEYLRAKGMDKASYLHEPYMLDFLKELFYTAQFRGTKKALELLSAFFSSYMSRSLDIGYYRELNAQSMFRLYPFNSYSGAYYADRTCHNMRNLIDIAYNASVLRDLTSILGSVYFNKKSDR